MEALPDLEHDQEAAARSFRVLFEWAPVGLCACTLDGRIFAMNPALQRLVGISDYRGLLVDDLTAPDQLVSADELLAEVATGATTSIEGELLRSDGKHVEVRATAMLVRAAAGEPSFALGLVEPLEDYRRAQKTAADARSVVHDLANLLMAIVANAERLLRSLPPSDSGRPAAEQLRDHAERAVRLARSGLGGAPERVDPRPVDVNGVILGLRTIARELLGAGIDITLELDSERPHALGDALGLERAIVNLATNARDAMPDGGTLTIETDERDGLVLIRISDTGTGIAPDVRDRIFDADFTTKPAGHGLGLSAVRDYVTKYGGSISVRSERGVGTEFTLTLPAAR